MTPHSTLKQLYTLAYQWIERQEKRGMAPEDAKKLVPLLLDFFEFVMAQTLKKASTKQADQQIHVQST